MTTSQCAVVLVIVSLLVGCETDIVQSEDSGLPDVSGSWTLTATGVPRLTDGSDGSCVFDSIHVQLRRDGEAVIGDQYRGDHHGLRIQCTGVTPEATQLSGITDTVIVMPPDTMSATVGNLCFNFYCDQTIDVTMRMGQLSFLGELATTETSMSGALWVLNQDTGGAPMTGSWSAKR